jgi:hypothetical protein
VLGVQLVDDGDGLGNSHHEVGGYAALVRAEPGRLAGVKLFDKQDTPLLPLP